MRGSGCRGEATVQERQRRSRGSADDRPGPAAFDDTTGVLGAVDPIDFGDGQRLTDITYSCDASVAIESAPYHQTGQSGHDGFGEGQDDEIEEEIDPEVVRVQNAHAVVVVGEVPDKGDARAPEIEERDREQREPDPGGQSAVEHARGHEALHRLGVIELRGVTTVLRVDGREIEVVGARGHGHVAHTTRRRHL